MVYVGFFVECKVMKDILDEMDIVIILYDVCCNDIEIIEKYNWNYVVFDEGYFIKNFKFKFLMVVKWFVSNYWFILIGIFIQNNVLELWFLFDFFMFGFFGVEKVFQDWFVKFIVNSCNSKVLFKE